MKQRFTWALLVMSAALVSACGVSDSSTGGGGPTSQVVAPTTQPTLPATQFPTVAPTLPTATPLPTDVPAVAAPQFSASDLAALKPTDILLQLEYAPNFTMPEFTHPFGRIAQFTLLADGTVLYIAEDQAADMPQPRLMRAQLTPQQTIAMVQQYLDAGLAQVESYTDMCEPGQGANHACIADAATTVTRVRLPGGALHESQNYASFATKGELLKTVVEQLQAYTHPTASDYKPEHATLFIAPVAEKPDGVTILDWPLRAEWLAAPHAGLDQWAKVVEGSDLEALLKVVQHNNGMYWFTSGASVYRTSLVPWLPGKDYRADVETYQMPPVDHVLPMSPTDAASSTALPVQTP